MLEALIPFVGAAVLIAMAPGPSTVVILRESVASGRRAGIAAILGNETGVLVWGLAAALGLTALLAASEFAYDAMRIVGGAVLICFGAKALWQTRRAGIHPERAAGSGDGPMSGPVDGAAPGSRRRSYRLGVVTNFANPKAGVFAVSFLPQFVPEGTAVPVMLVALSVLWVMIDMIWYLALVWLVDRARRVLDSADVRRRLERFSGLVLIGLGARLAVETRRA